MTEPTPKTIADIAQNAGVTPAAIRAMSHADVRVTNILIEASNKLMDIALEERRAGREHLVVIQTVNGIAELMPYNVHHRVQRAANALLQPPAEDPK